MSIKDALSNDKEDSRGWLENQPLIDSSIKHQKLPGDLGLDFSFTLSNDASLPITDRIFLKNRKPARLVPEFPMKNILASRAVFYPGAGNDGQPLKIFCESHSAHCFIYADYLKSKKELIKQLKENLASYYWGYKTLFAIEGRAKDFFPEGYNNISDKKEKSFKWGMWAVLERDSDYSNGPDPKRIIFCYLCCDEVSAFASLWPKDKKDAPYAVVINDNNPNLTREEFGGEQSPLYRIVPRNQENKPITEWLLTVENSKEWPEYKRITEPELSQEDQLQRTLFKKSSTMVDDNCNSLIEHSTRALKKALKSAQPPDRKRKPTPS